MKFTTSSEEHYNTTTEKKHSLPRYPLALICLYNFTMRLPWLSVLDFVPEDLPQFHQTFIINPCD